MILMCGSGSSSSGPLRGPEDTLPSYANMIKCAELKVQIRETAFVTIFALLSIWKQ